MILGVTGGIGSGKSTVSGYLCEKYGFVFISCDDLAKQMMTEDPELVGLLKNAFGEEIYTADGLLDKKRYASLIYGSEEQRKLSDSLVHPAVWKKIRELTGDPGKDYLVETALPDQNFRNLCDRILFVRVEPEERIHRLMASRGYTEAYARSVMANQKPDIYFEKLSDHVIDNSGKFEETAKAADRIAEYEKCFLCR